MSVLSWDNPRAETIFWSVFMRRMFHSRSSRVHRGDDDLRNSQRGPESENGAHHWW